LGQKGEERPPRGKRLVTTNNLTPKKKTAGNQGKKEKKLHRMENEPCCAQAERAGLGKEARKRGNTAGYRGNRAP